MQDAIRKEVEERWPNDPLAIELFEVSERACLLHHLCLLPSIEGMAEYTRTSDGFFLGRPVGDIGFNAFLGQPPTHVQARNKSFYDALSETAQAEVRSRLARQQIPLAAVLG